VFENFLTNFIGAMGQGFAASGHGPGSFMRGFGAAVSAPWQLQQQQQAFQTGQQAQQAQIEQEQARTAQTQQQTQLMGQSVPVTLPNGQTVYVPATQAGGVLGNVYKGGYGAQVTAQSRLDVETLKNQAAQGRVARVEDAKDPQTGKWGRLAYDAKGQPLGFLPGNPIDPKLLPTSNTSQQWLETSPGTWELVNKTSTSQKGTPSGFPQPTPQNQLQDKVPGLKSAGVAPSTPAPSQRGKIFGNASVYAFNPQTGETEMTTPAQVAAQGMTNVRKPSPKEIQDDTQLNNRLVDVATKISRYEQEAVKPLSVKDAATLSGLLSEDKFKLGAFGAELPVDFVNKFMGAARDRNLSEDAIRRVVSFYNARESMVGYQRVLSGSGRSSEKAMQLNLDALPHPLKSPQYAREALGQFKENLSIAGRGLPRMPGIPTANDILHPPQQKTVDFAIPEIFGRTQ
jgi:hypothetical protein